ncbi:MAG: GNAT family N-acetyltransferase [Steroidobacteraceae bacterium]|nr:GNAT family N-acetyltransferase [Steroidobacteraceae bacterium]
MSTSPTIRRATRADAPELERLFGMLGYPIRSDSILARWAEWEAAGNIALVADRQDGTLAGVITLHHTHVLHRERPVGRISALVVDASVRGRGIGRSLVAAAEVILTEAGCEVIEVTSNMRRTDAHAFYERLGYERTSYKFAKRTPCTV